MPKKGIINGADRVATSANKTTKKPGRPAKKAAGEHVPARTGKPVATPVRSRRKQTTGLSSKQRISSSEGAGAAATRVTVVAPGLKSARTVTITNAPRRYKRRQQEPKWHEKHPWLLASVTGVITLVAFVLCVAVIVAIARWAVS